MKSRTIAKSFLCLTLTVVSVFASDKVGQAGFYSDKFEGRTMANGQPLAQAELTAAVSAYPLGSTVRLTNLATKKSAVVRVTDRLGPDPGAIAIVTRAVAEQLGFTDAGQAKVQLELIERGQEQRQPRNPRERLERRRASGGLAPPGLKPSPFAYSRTMAGKR